jgi:hypothetical protein
MCWFAKANGEIWTGQKHNQHDKDIGFREMGMDAYPIGKDAHSMVTVKYSMIGIDAHSIMGTTDKYSMRTVSHSHISSKKQKTI